MKELCVIEELCVKELRVCVCVCENTVCDKEKFCVTMLYVKESCV